MYLETQERRENEAEIIMQIIVDGFPDFIWKHQPMDPTSSGNLKKEKYKEKQLGHSSQRADNLRWKDNLQSIQEKWDI